MAAIKKVDTFYTLKNVITTFQVPGFHCWENAPDKFAYLRTPHRHVFHVTVHVPVAGSDRDVEFIELKTIAQDVFVCIADKWMFNHPDFGSRSCEMLCDELAHRLVESFGIFPSIVKIFEDGENGAVMAFKYKVEDASEEVEETKEG